MSCAENRSTPRSTTSTRTGRRSPSDDCQLRSAQTERRTVRVTDDAFTRKDGSIFAVAYSGVPLLRGNDLRGAVVVFRDTTEEQAERAVSSVSSTH